MKPCAICGVFRRYGMNQVAKEHGASRLATGHNLDDLAQSILMNVATGDLEKLFRLGPHLSPVGGLVPRFFPLRSIPEKEILLYAMTNGIPFRSSECPYADTATRGRYRDVLMLLEDRDPGTRHSLLNFHQSLMERSSEMRKDLTVVRCRSCNEPSAGTECKRCQYLRRIVQIRPAKKPKNDQ